MSSEQAVLHVHPAGADRYGQARGSRPHHISRPDIHRCESMRRFRMNRPARVGSKSFVARDSIFYLIPVPRPCRQTAAVEPGDTEHTTSRVPMHIGTNQRRDDASRASVQSFFTATTPPKSAFSRSFLISYGLTLRNDKCILNTRYTANFQLNIFS